MAKVIFNSLTGEATPIHEHILLVDEHDVEEYLRTTDEGAETLDHYGSAVVALENDHPDAAEAAVATAVPLASAIGAGKGLSDATEIGDLHGLVENELRAQGFTDEGDWPTGDMVEVIAAAVVKHLRG